MPRLHLLLHEVRASSSVSFHRVREAIHWRSQAHQNVPPAGRRPFSEYAAHQTDHAVRAESVETTDLRGLQLLRAWRSGGGRGARL